MSPEKTVHEVSEYKSSIISPVSLFPPADIWSCDTESTCHSFQYLPFSPEATFLSYLLVQMSCKSLKDQFTKKNIFHMEPTWEMSFCPETWQTHHFHICLMCGGIYLNTFTHALKMPMMLVLGRGLQPRLKISFGTIFFFNCTIFSSLCLVLNSKWKLLSQNCPQKTSI